ncbi:TolB family protein [Polyangium spumosum]|uniref:TolB protein n=1 Tax=Polyangium spumosum TaxID=889282 RepID=A0A6N7PLK9_9BACT|nr:hypothetical protein [Polyangium spumosum]MRG91130.1 hypothetical protein [Polyangium spumosum]
MGIFLVTALGGAVLAAACGGGSSSSGAGGNPSSGSGGSNSGGNGGLGGDGGDIFVGPASGVGGGGGQVQGLDVQPSLPQEITVVAGQNTPTVTYSSFLDGNPIGAGWSVDRGEIGSVTPGPATTATFTPKGAVGGVVRVRAGLNGEVVERNLLVKLTGQQNGADPSNPAQAGQIATTIPELTAGGGVGGVGGEGLGVGVESPAVIAALDTPASNGQGEGLKFLYPYDRTVWPRGMTAPLLQWESTLGDVDAIKIELTTTSGSFSWKGTFGKPQILAQTGGPFLRHPIPQDVWAMATNTAGGKTLDGSPDQLVVRLTVAKGEMGYGPITETWTVAPGRLSGAIYYTSYGTNLAKNLGGAVGGDGMFGGAVLSIKVGDTGPKLAAGQSGDSTQCRVCHSVAANGSRLVATTNGGAQRFVYDISPNAITQTSLPNGSAFPGITPDGALALTTGATLVSLADGTVQPSSGLTGTATNVGTPSFSPDGKRVVFNPMASASITNPQQKLVLMDFDPATNTFANPLVLVDNTGAPAETRPGWPAFFPDGKAVVYHQQIAAGVDGNNLGDMRTRKGAKAYLAMARADGGAPVPLDNLNGKDGGNVYLPKLAQPVSMTCTGDGSQVGGLDADHGDDVNMNYEPTVNPIASGGYAWVVFTSRRMYGSVATIPPYCSDPRGVNLITNITPKKLWVAAVDLNSPAGVDGSHPAFYLPAQELLAGNTRGFWVQEPCRADGSGCDSGDQCCNGYCSPDPMNADVLVCGDTPPNGMCSNEGDKCTTQTDCCDPELICLNGFCTLDGPK